MCKKLSDFLSGMKMTVIAGIFLVVSLVMMAVKVTLPIDPAWGTVVISGIPLVYLAISRLIHQRWISSALLISIAMAASLMIGELFAAGEVAFIMAIGALLEDKTVEKAQRGLKGLIDLTPSKGRLLAKKGEKTEERMIPAEKIKKGDVLRVLPGESIPADGIILSGNTSVDQAVMTGESLPVDKEKGDRVFCGTLNCFGSIDVEATNAGKDSSLQKMIDMVKEAEDKKAPMQRIADQWATWLVPIALLIAAGAYLFTWDITRAVTVLVVFCPCALALATPVSVMAAIGQATKAGVLIKSGEALEKLGRADCIAFDKTGTLTYGKLKISDVVPFAENMSKEELLGLSARAELRSEHPLGKAIVEYARGEEIELKEPDDFGMFPGKGIYAVLEGRKYRCGSPGYLKEEGVSISERAEAVLEELREEGKASIFVAREKTCIGAIAMSDILRPQAKEVVDKLRKMNTQVVLMTGDNRRTAGYFASMAGITDICANLLPEQKVNGIAELQKQGKKVCMVGDGVNDAPALKTADVSMAMGTMGSDMAIEAADIALMGDDISKIPYVRRLSISTLHTIKGNIAASMCINLVAICLSVLGILNPITGALVHNAGSVLVVLNAALLYDRKFDS